MDTAAWGSASVLMVGAGVGAGVGGIGQCLLASNRFSGVDSELGQGVPCLTGALGMSSSGTGLEWTEEFLLSWGLSVRYGISANCPVANLYTITNIDAAVDLTTGVWVEAVATVGVGTVGVVVVGTGWARTLNLYPLLVITVLFLLSFACDPGAFLAIGLEFWGRH